MVVTRLVHATTNRRIGYGMLVAFALGFAGLLAVAAPLLGSTSAGDPMSVVSPGIGPAPAGPSVAPLGADERQMLEQLAAASVVRVTGASCTGTTVGTGFFHDGSIVTNSHVIGPADQAVVDGPAVGRGTPAVMAARAEAVDLAWLNLSGASLPSVAPSLDTALPEVGERVLLVGYGGGRRLRFQEATVHLVVDGRAYGVAGTAVLIDGLSGPGFSGGPVLNRNGSVVAVLKGVDEATELTVAVSVAMFASASSHHQAPRCFAN